jgi:uncharacterized membrane-anchored protein YhcB (DUF1043 family)
VRNIQATFVTSAKNLEVMNEDDTRVQHHKLETNDELRTEKSAKEMLHVQM